MPEMPEGGNAPEVDVTLGAALTLPLATSARLRRTTRRRARVGTALAALVLLLLVPFVFSPVPPGAKAFTALVCAALVVAIVLHRRSAKRTIEARGTLTIDDTTLRIEHPAQLREPWQLPRLLLRTVALHEGDEVGLPGGEQVRFLWHVSQWEDPGSARAGARGWLWSDRAAPVATLGPRGERPNLALVFSEPVAAPRMRRTHDDAPLPGEAVPALLLHVELDSAATKALRSTQLLRPLSGDDAELVRRGLLGS